MMLHRINALMLKYYYITINRFDRMFDLFYWPLLDIFIWGFMSIHISKISNLNLISFIFGGIILWLFVWRSSQDISVFVLEDFWSRNVYNLFSTPLMLKELVISLIIWALIRTIIAFAFLTLVAYLIYHFTIFTIGILYLGMFVLVLIIFSWALGLFISSFIMRFGSKIQVLAWSLVWIVQPFSCVFYPLNSLPVWAQHIAVLLPTTYIFENMRAVLSGNDVNPYTMLLAIFLSLIFFLVSAMFFYSSFKSAKKSGLLAKNE